MKRIQRLQDIMDVPQIIIADPVSIYYFTGQRIDAGERLLALIVFKDKEPLLFLNELFTAPHSPQTITYRDDDIAIDVLKEYLITGTVAIDGTWPSRFVFPLIKDYAVIDGSALIESIRRIKDSDELQLMAIASQHNDRIMGELFPLIREGISEIELATQIREKQSCEPLSGVSFTPIVLFGENSADPHGIPSQRRLKKNDLILIDMGGFYQDYASDMTRCFFFGSNKALESIYDIVLQANEAAIAQVKPGVTLASIDKAARDVIVAAGYGHAFVHRTGHGIGLETHENLDVSQRNKTRIEPGMCFSIEPGIYIPGLGGVRIEDLVHVTKEGVNVMNAFPKHLVKIDS